MARSKEELLAKLSECVVEMEEDEVVDVSKEYIEGGYPAFDGIMEGLVGGMNEASDLYDAEEYFVTDVLLCSDAMYAGLEVLRPHLTENADALSFDAVVPMKEARANLGDRVLMGNVSTFALEFGDEERVEKLTKFCVRGGSDIIAPACRLGTRSPITNIQAILKTLKMDEEEFDKVETITELEVEEMKNA